MVELRDIVFRVAKHEIGHWLGWKTYGGKSKGIQVQIFSVNGRHTGAAKPILKWPTLDNESASMYVKARIICLYCGVYSEAYLNPLFDTDFIRANLNHLGSANADFHKSVELTHLYSNLLGRYEDYKNVCFELDQEAAGLVVDNFSFIQYAANKVADLAKYEGQLIEISDETLSNWYQILKENANDS